MLAVPVRKKKSTRKKKNLPRFDLKAELQRVCGVDHQTSANFGEDHVGFGSRPDQAGSGKLNLGRNRFCR
jgi:hypothetical protein